MHDLLLRVKSLPNAFRLVARTSEEGLKRTGEETRCSSPHAAFNLVFRFLWSGFAQSQKWELLLPALRPSNRMNKVRDEKTGFA
jgi:hypothetical protein